MKSEYKTLNISRLHMIRLCTQHNNYNDKTSVKFTLMNDTPYLVLTGEFWGVFSELCEDKWPRYIESALYSKVTCQYQGCWCPSSLHRQVISRQWDMALFLHHKQVLVFHWKRSEIRLRLRKYKYVCKFPEMIYGFTATQKCLLEQNLKNSTNHRHHEWNETIYSSI